MEEPTSPVPEVRVVLVTAPDLEVARGLARSLVGNRLAACVNLIPGAVSVYRWEGEVQEEAEVMMVVKTSAARLPELEASLAAEHPYDVPECVALAPDAVESKYGAWLLAETGSVS